MFGIEIEDIDVFNNADSLENRPISFKSGFNKENNEKVKFLNACSSITYYKTKQDFEFVQTGVKFPNMYLFGNQIYSNGEEFSNCMKVIPGTFLYDFGPQLKIPSMDRFYSLSEIGCFDSHLTLQIYYHPVYGALDLSSYVVYALFLGVKHFFLDIRIQGRTQAIPIDLSKVYRVGKKKRNENLGFQSEGFNSSLNEYLVDKSIPDRDKQVILRINNSLVSVTLRVYKQGYPGRLMTHKEGYLGSTKGTWIYCDYESFEFRIFLRENQSSLFPLSEWVFSLFHTILKGRYLITVVEEEFQFPVNSKVVELGLTAMETCHCATQWKCDHYAAFKMFDKRSKGRNKDYTNSTLKDYFGAYTYTPYIKNSFKVSEFDATDYPCGICPMTKNPGRIERKLKDRLKLIQDFNYGIVGQSGRLEPSVGGFYTVTKPAYGVKFVKYQSINLIPSILYNFHTTPELCGCSFGEVCDQCDMVAIDKHSFVSPLYGIKKYDWSDVFNIYMVRGKPYVMHNIGKDSVVPKGRPPDLDCNDVIGKSAIATRLLASVYTDYMAAISPSKHPTTKSTYFDLGSSLLSSGITDKDAEARFFGIISMFRRAPKRKGYEHIWQLIQNLFCTGIRGNYSDDRAVKEFASVVLVLNDYGQYGTVLTQSDIDEVRSLLMI
jgi:hypothetical protein